MGASQAKSFDRGASTTRHSGITRVVLCLSSLTSKRLDMFHCFPHTARCRLCHTSQGATALPARSQLSVRMYTSSVESDTAVLVRPDEASKSKGPDKLQQPAMIPNATMIRLAVEAVGSCITRDGNISRKPAVPLKMQPYSRLQKKASKSFYKGVSRLSLTGRLPKLILAKGLTWTITAGRCGSGRHSLPVSELPVA